MLPGKTLTILLLCCGILLVWRDVLSGHILPPPKGDLLWPLTISCHILRGKRAGSAATWGRLFRDCTVRTLPPAHSKILVSIGQLGLTSRLQGSPTEASKNLNEEWEMWAILWKCTFLCAIYMRLMTFEGYLQSTISHFYYMWVY